MSIADLRDVMETMFFGPAGLTRAVVPRMRAQGWGRRSDQFRTGLLGRSLRAAPALEQYAETVGATRAYFESEAGNQAGDPAKSAAAILAAPHAEQPPLRLALGADAVDGIRAKHEGLLAELAHWEDIARATSFDA